MAIVGRPKYTRAGAKFRGDATRREGSAKKLEIALPLRRVSSKFHARVCISAAPLSPSPKLETTRSLLIVVSCVFIIVGGEPGHHICCTSGKWLLQVYRFVQRQFTSGHAQVCSGTLP